MGSDYEMSQDEDEDGDNSQVNGQSSNKKRQIDDDEYDSEVIPFEFNKFVQYDSEQEASKSVSKFGGINEEEEQFTLPFNAVRYLGQQLKELAKTNRSLGGVSASSMLPDDVLFQ